MFVDIDDEEFIVDDNTNTNILMESNEFSTNKAHNKWNRRNEIGEKNKKTLLV